MNLTRDVATVLLSSTVLLGLAHVSAQAQVVPASSDNTNTIVTQNGSSFDITGGTTAGRNLFQSFQTFGLNADQSANFRANPAIQNILGRVVGGDTSIINGLIQVTGSNANLYLMNPAGIVFGANARLDVAGSFTATTANGIGFGTRWFNAIGSNDYANLIGTPNSLAFTMAQPGVIVNTADLAVREGQRLMLAGGTVVSTGTLTAPQGHIVVTTVPGSSLIQITEVGRLLRLEVQPFIVTANQPQPWTQNVASLPALLTGNSLGNATNLTVNSNGSVSLNGSGLRVQQGDIVVTQPISGSRTLVNSTSVSTAPLGVTMVASNKITTEDIQVNSVNLNERPTIDVTAKGDIQTGRIDFAGNESPQIPVNTIPSISDNNPPDSNGIFKGVKLFSQTGNITVETIRTFDGDVDVTAAGLFRATGFFGDDPPSGVFDSQTFNIDNGYTKRLSLYLPQDPASNQFFIDKTGLTQTELDTALAGNYFAEARVYAPVSIRAFGIITIRYGSGSSLAYGSRFNSASLTAAGNAPFVIGPNSFPRLGDRYIPANPSDRFENFRLLPFDVIQNESYTLATLPDGVSGTRGAIVQGILANGTFYTPLQSLVFGTLPPSPCLTCGLQAPTNPASSPVTNPDSNPAIANPAIGRLVALQERFQDGQVAQQQLNSWKQDVSCELPTTIASSSIPETRLFRIFNACTATSDNAQLLKLLSDDAGSVKGR